MADKNQNDRKGKEPRIIRLRLNLSWIYIIVLFGLGWWAMKGGGVAPQKVEWADVKEMVGAGDVKEIHFVRNDYKGTVTIRPEALAKYEARFPGGKVPSRSPHFTFLVSGHFDAENEFGALNEALPVGSKVPVIMENESRMWSQLLEWIVPFVFLILLWVWMFRSMNRNMGGGPGGGGPNPFNVGKSTGKLADKNKVDVRFKDVAGLYGAKEEVMEIVDFLKNPARYTALGAKIPKGALLVGPPGTGKTLLAKAVAGEADVPFFSISGSDFVEMFVGVGASRVRDLFAQAKQKAPCIVFIDEIDAVGRARSKNAGFTSNDERENTLNQLLTEMDGFGTNSGVIVLAATNRADILDGALMRAGRFDRQIRVELPDLNERKEIFQVHLKPLKLDPAFDLDLIAKNTPGFSGADIANVCNEAALGAARKGKKTVDNMDFSEAVDRVVGGIERKKTIMTKAEKRLTAFHEAGHAVAGWLLPGCDPVLKVSIIPRGQALGLTWHLPEEKVTISKSDLIDEMCSLVAGRVAEEEVNDGVPCTGALSDFERMTKMAYAMVTYYGMSDKLGNISYYDPSGASFQFDKPYSEKTAELIDSEAKALVDMVTERTRRLLRDNWEGLTKLAEQLIDKEIIMSDDIQAIFGPKAGRHGEDRFKDEAPAEDMAPEADEPASGPADDTREESGDE